MSSIDVEPARSVSLPATDLRRLPIFGLALGAAIGGLALRILEHGFFATAVAIAAWATAIVCLAAVLPGANTLRLDAEGLTVRSWLVFTGRVAWRDVVSIEAGDGWSGGRVLLELAPSADAARIVGLPRDPDLDRRSLVDGYGTEPEDLARMMRSFRESAVAEAKRP
jgi:hypothetical protein